MMKNNINPNFQISNIQNERHAFKIGLLKLVGVEFYHKPFLVHASIIMTTNVLNFMIFGLEFLLSVDRSVSQLQAEALSSLLILSIDRS